MVGSYGDALFRGTPLQNETQFKEKETQAKNLKATHTLRDEKAFS